MFDSWLFFCSFCRNPAEEYEEKPRKILQQGKRIRVQIQSRKWVLGAESAPQVPCGREHQPFARTFDAAAQFALLRREWWGLTLFWVPAVSVTGCFLVEQILELGMWPEGLHHWMLGWWKIMARGKASQTRVTKGELKIRCPVGPRCRQLVRFVLLMPPPGSAAHSSWLRLEIAVRNCSAFAMRTVFCYCISNGLIMES